MKLNRTILALNISFKFTIKFYLKQCLTNPFIFEIIKLNLK